MTCNIFLDLPNSKMPALGYGTWQGLDKDLEIGLEVALEAGYRHIDTAQWYNNEEVVGKVLKKWFETGKLKREDVFVTTKITPMVYPDKVEETLKEQLQKLQLDCVDLYLIHFPVVIYYKDGVSFADEKVTHLDIWKKLEEQYDAGRTKHIGVSNFNQKQIERLLKKCRIKPHNLQVELHAYMMQKELVDYCQQNGITVVAYAPLGSRGYNDYLKKIGKEKKYVPDLFDNVVVKKLSEKHSKTPAQIVLRYLLQCGVAPIPKSVTPSRIKENFGIFDFSLDNVDIQALRDIEIGPSIRICDMMLFGETVRNHPDFPF